MKMPSLNQIKSISSGLGWAGTAGSNSPAQLAPAQPKQSAELEAEQKPNKPSPRRRRRLPPPLLLLLLAAPTTQPRTSPSTYPFEDEPQPRDPREAAARGGGPRRHGRAQDRRGLPRRHGRVRGQLELPARQHHLHGKGSFPFLSCPLP
jgi:hypothetical protein